MKYAYDFSTEGALSFDRNVISSKGAKPSQKSQHVRNCCPRQIFDLVRDGKLLMLYTLNPKEMRVNACDVRFVVCVPTLN